MLVTVNKVKMGMQGVEAVGRTRSQLLFARFAPVGSGAGVAQAVWKGQTWGSADAVCGADAAPVGKKLERFSS